MNAGNLINILTTHCFGILKRRYTELEKIQNTARTMLSWSVILLEKFTIINTEKYFYKKKCCSNIPSEDDEKLLILSVEEEFILLEYPIYRVLLTYLKEHFEPVHSIINVNI